MLKKILLLFIVFSFAHAEEVQLQAKDRSQMAFFMVRHQDIVKNNKKNFKRLIKRLENNQIIGLELIVAAATKTRVESRFGHTLLRFVDNHGVVGDDLVLSFVADLDSPQLSSRRGIFGGYPVYPLLKSFRMFNKDYVKNDNRPLERHIIPTSQKMRSDLILSLNKWWDELLENQIELDREQSEKAKEKALKVAHKILKDKPFNLIALKSEDSGIIYAWTVVQDTEGKRKIHHIEPVKLEVAFSENFGKYKFLSNNCAGALIKFLKKIKFPTRGSLLWAGRIPVKIPVYFEKSLLNPLPSKLIPGLSPFRERLKKILSIENLDDPKAWPKNSFSILSQELSLVEKIRLIDAIYSAPEELKQQIRDSLPPHRERPKYEEVYQLVDLPLNLYELCKDSLCAARYRETALNIWNKDLINQKINRQKRLFKKLKKDKLKEDLRTRPEVIEHFKLIYLEK